MRNLFQSLRRKAAQDNTNVPDEARILPIPSLIDNPYQSIRNLTDLECRFGSMDKLYEQIASCSNELRDGPGRIEVELKHHIRAWRRSVDSNLFIYSILSVGTSAFAVFASAVGFIPVYGPVMLGLQLIAQLLSIPAAESLHRIARQRLNSADQVLEDPKCLRGVKFVLGLTQRGGRDAVVDVVLCLLLLLVNQDRYADSRRVKANFDKLIEVSSAQRAPQTIRKDKYAMKVDELFRLLGEVKASLLSREAQPKGLRDLLNGLAGAFSWVPDAIPGFLLQCYAGIARGAELAMSLLYLGRVIVHMIFSSLFHVAGVADAKREVVFFLGEWMGYGISCITLASAAVALVLSWLALSAAVENCYKLRKAAENAERKIQNDALECVNATRLLRSQVMALAKGVQSSP